MRGSHVRGIRISRTPLVAVKTRAEATGFGSRWGFLPPHIGSLARADPSLAISAARWSCLHSHFLLVTSLAQQEDQLAHLAGSACSSAFEKPKHALFHEEGRFFGLCLGEITRVEILRWSSSAACPSI